MPNTGIVREVFGANVPDTNRPARNVIVAKADDTEVAFFIPEEGAAPDTGEAISWGPHHAWWTGEKDEKLSWKLLP